MAEEVLSDTKDATGFASHTFVDAAPDVLVEMPEELSEIFKS